jgi:hypothetical protein
VKAESVLRANWTGASTVPSRRQYPHQWGWDAAFIAFGWARIEPERGERELESILRGQWADGRVPHIVFDPGVPEDAYFPGPAFWRSAEAPGAPAGVATSGLTQPPLHARAALAVARRAPEGTAFLRRVFPRLAAQHAYLAGRRDAGGSGLAAIVHPWESGLDDSPAWDEPLAAVELPPEGVAPYVRRDREYVDPSERPSDAAYDRFVQLARDYRDGGYADVGARSAFLVEDPLFNAIWLWSTHALAEIAVLAGEDPGPYRESAAAIHAGLMARLWDAGRGRFLARDVHTGRLLDRRTVGTLAPLLDPDLAHEVARALAGELGSPHFRSDAGIGVASYDLLAPDADPRRYWRGPVWANLNWLLAHGLRVHRLDGDADALDATTLRLVRDAGLREYFDPRTGEGRGAPDFSWTAATVLDIIKASS